MTRSLKINWRAPQPPSPAKEWHDWSKDEGVSGKAAAANERALGWPAGTLAYLEKAFAKNLSRQTGWITHENAGLNEAAKFFRRGVASKAENHTTPASTFTQGHYEVCFANAWGELEEKWSAHSGAAAFVIDSQVQKHWKDVERLSPSVLVEAAEAKKNLDTVAALLNDPGLREKKLWIIVGGGIVSDIAAFAAALLNKEFIFVPTTLLAMADACVGGKTGVNFPPYGKNQVGAFAFPKAVWIWPGWLKTLAAEEFAAGLAECLKHAFLSNDKTLIQKLVDCGKKSSVSIETILEVVAYKAKVVEEDPTETGKRAVLNFGHTLAHALEAISQNTNATSPLRHGEAVAVGMKFAAQLSQKLCALSESDRTLINRALKESGCLPSASRMKACLGHEWNDARLSELLADFMGLDKKNLEKNSLNFVLLKALGEINNSESNYLTPVSPAILKKELKEFNVN